MEVILDGIGRLTTAHAASSYGQPVLLMEGSMDAIGAGDLVEMDGGMQPAALLVRRWIDAAGEKVTDEERGLADAFISVFAGAG